MSQRVSKQFCDVYFMCMKRSYTHITINGSFDADFVHEYIKCSSADDFCPSGESRRSVYAPASKCDVFIHTNF